MLTKKTDEQIAECIEKQERLYREKDYPDFAPKSGVCWKCHRNIYQNYKINERESIGETGDRLVTGCPHCCRSYCD